MSYEIESEEDPDDPTTASHWAVMDRRSGNLLYGKLESESH